MKQTLDLDELLASGAITEEEHARLSALSKKTTGSLGVNILIGFGVIAIVASLMAMSPSAGGALVVGSLTAGGGIAVLHFARERFGLVGNIMIMVGAILAAVGFVGNAGISVGSLLVVVVVLAGAGLAAGSSLLMVLATLAGAVTIGAATYYGRGSYSLVIQEPMLTVVLFTVAGIATYLLSQQVPKRFEGPIIASARTSAFLVNFGFWVGSIWGDADRGLSSGVFSIGWALALIAALVWALQANRRWTVNLVATFGGIHFYTFLFGTAGFNAGTLLVAGLGSVAAALWIRSMNRKMVARAVEPVEQESGS
jgi:hypothetical protein